jgi:membrane protease subunit (stomatin/prohibitin family)
MDPKSTLAIAERRFPDAGWVTVEGKHGELYVVSSRGGRGVRWETKRAVAVTAELVAVLAVQLRHTSAHDVQLSHPSRAYVAVEAEEGHWVVADAFMRFDDPDTLPFDPPR